MNHYLINGYRIAAPHIAAARQIASQLRREGVRPGGQLINRHPSQKPNAHCEVTQ